MSFFARLEARVDAADSLLCVGLDPHPDDLKEVSATAAKEFCLQLVEATASEAAAFKPNVAFFEAIGPAGIQALQEVVAAIPEEIPVILDAKRGDIASTARAYARAVFETLGAQAVTINPYLGRDAVVPFLENPERGVFLLCKTSNPGSQDLQDLVLQPVGGDEPEMLYERVARLAQGWSENDNLGLVVGATHPEALRRVRRIAPDLWILAPGVGAQGGDLDAALRAGLRRDGGGLLVNVSRTISRAEDQARAARSIREAINEGRRISAREGKATLYGSRTFPSELADKLLEAGCVRFGKFQLKSGLISPIYIDLRKLVAYPDILQQVARAYLPVLRKLHFNRLAALPYAALPIGTAISLQSGWPMVYPRKETKEYGTRAEVEGEYQPGERVVVIDDLATTGGSKFEAIDKLGAAGLIVQDVVVLIDRQSGAKQALEEAGYRMHSVFLLTDLLDYWEDKGRVPREEVARARAFLES